MYELNQVVNGITRYLDNEIIPNVVGWQKWVVGAGLGVGLSKSTNVFNAYKDHPMVKSLELVDSNDLIDIDLLHKEFSKQAEKGAITFDMPFVGPLTLNRDDVDKLYTYIKG